MSWLKYGLIKQEKTREQRESELIPKVTEAISLGVNVIEDAFEKLDTNIDNSDSEDEDASYRVDPILEAKVMSTDFLQHGRVFRLTCRGSGVQSSAGSGPKSFSSPVTFVAPT